MAPEATDALSLAQWVQSGSLLAFAGAVLWELRQQRNERNQQAKITAALLGQIDSALAILLDRHGVKRRPPTPLPVEDGEQHD